jgi:hypothetical protein
MNRFKNLFTIFAFSLLVLGLPLIASAQWRNDRNDDDYYRNNRNNRNLQATIKNLKNRAKQFERQIDRELDRDRYNDRNYRGDRIDNLAEDFVRATKRLDDEYDNRRDYNNSSDEARQVLQIGSQLDRALSRSRLDYGSQNQWNQIRQDLRILADAYNYNYNDRNRNNRNNRNDDWRRNIPFPLPF